MKYTITINQYAIFVNGLVNKTDSIDWIIIDYLKDFALYKKARKIVYENEEFIWLNYNHLMLNLPIVKIHCKSGITKRINKLKKLGLIKTHQQADNTLYYTFTDRLIDCLFIKQSDLNRVKAQQDMSLRGAEQRSNLQLRNVRDCHANARNDKSSAPVNSGYIGAVHRGYTAQYKTKNTIINKDNNNDISFSSSFNKNNKQIKPRMDPAPFDKLNKDNLKTCDLSSKQPNKRCGVNTDRKLPIRLCQEVKRPRCVSVDEAKRNQQSQIPDCHANARNNKSSAVSAFSAVKDINGFTTLQGNIWKVLANIQQRQAITNKNIRMNSRINPAPICDGV